MASKRLEFWLAVLFLVAAVSVITAQVLHVGALSELEVSLFSSLQFLLALLFGWVVTRLVTFEQFQASQRKFALAAFRRILEIRASLERLQRYISKTAHGTDADLLESALTSAQGAVQSSVADWADIIGDEISITRDIERLRTLPTDLGITEPVSSKTSDPAVAHESETVEELLARLPPELREQLHPADDRARLRDAVQSLIDEFDLHGEVVLKAFWEEDDFPAAALREQVQPGNSVFLARGDTKARKDALLVYADSGQAVGVVTNSLLPVKYKEFSEAIGKYSGGKTLRANVASVESEMSAGGRKYFRLAVRTKPAPDAFEFVLSRHLRHPRDRKAT
jgi:hypothetical protein